LPHEFAICTVSALWPPSNFGWGSGTSTSRLARQLRRPRYQRQAGRGWRSKFLDLESLTGDIERLPSPTRASNGVLLSGSCTISRPSRCATEIVRVHCGPAGTSSPSMPIPPHESVHVALPRRRLAIHRPVENERPVFAHEVPTVFTRAGFDLTSHYVSGLSYR
jgi:hypothetical protein